MMMSGNNYNGNDDDDQSGNGDDDQSGNDDDDYIDNDCTIVYYFSYSYHVPSLLSFQYLSL